MQAFIGVQGPLACEGARRTPVSIPITTRVSPLRRPRAGLSPSSSRRPPADLEPDTGFVTAESVAALSPERRDRLRSGRPRRLTARGCAAPGAPATSRPTTAPPGRGARLCRRYATRYFLGADIVGEQGGNTCLGGPTRTRDTGRPTAIYGSRDERFGGTIRHNWRLFPGKWRH